MWWLLLLLILPTAHAASLDSGTTTVLMSPGFVEVSEEYVIDSVGAEDLSIPVPSDAAFILAEMDKKERTCKLINNSAKCGSTKSGQHVFNIKYQTKEVLGNLDGRTIIKFNKGLPFKAKEHKFILKLPVGTIIPHEPGKEQDFYITPKPDKVLSDGQRIILEWTERDTQQVAVAVITEPVEKGNWTTFIFLVIIACSAGALAAWYVLRARSKSKNSSNNYNKNTIKNTGKNIKTKKKKPTDKNAESEIKTPANTEVSKEIREVKEIKESDVETDDSKESPVTKTIEPIIPQFIENEQKVVNLLSSAPNNELWQKQILLETGFSKAKLSRVIRNLEQRGVLVKEIYGNTNKIALKKPQSQEIKPVEKQASEQENSDFKQV